LHLRDRIVRAVATLLALSACSASAAFGSNQTVRFSAAFVPERPGQRTTAEFEVQVDSVGEQSPPPLTEARISYPAGLGIALSGLGIDTCSRQTLEARGAKGCPAGSFMGQGLATAEMQFGPNVVSEPADVLLVRTPQAEGSLAMLFLINGADPVYAQPLLDGLLVPAPAPYGGALDVSIPLIAGLPGGTDVSVVQIRLVLGPRGLTYYEHVAGKLVPYHPRGLRLPARCPRGGFPFSISLGFLGGGNASASTSVRCPKLHRVKPRA
jgi:hypothetical protein